MIVWMMLWIRYIRGIFLNVINKRISLTFTIITLAWVAVIFSFSLQPGGMSGEISGSLAEKIAAIFMPTLLDYPEQLEALDFFVRKCAHFTEFMILGMLSSISLGCWQLRHKGLCAMGFCVIVAAVDEMLQLFVGGRNGRVLDGVLDSAGSLVGIVVCLYFFQSCRRNCE